jgi:SNF2 family DNA or RNA helicase
MLVIDESKALGNPRSGFTKSVIELSKRAKVVRELNGTPITQNVMDYYGQLRALGELNGWNPVAFRNRFAVMGGFMGKQILPEFKNGDELARILDGCSFRALKADWRKDLPEKTYSTVHLEMTGEQLSRYRTMMEEFYALVGDEDSGTMVTAELVLTQLGKLRQISSGILIESWLDENSRPRSKTHQLLEPKDNPKLKAVLELCNGPGKSIVVHYHKECGKMLAEALGRAGLEPAIIRGGMKTDEIVEQKRRFNDDPACRVIVGQERAIALGHTLLGKPGKDRCNRTVFFENSYSLYHRLQVEDRNHRGEQDQMCSVIDLVTSPVEEATVRILTGKREMAQSMDEVVAAVRAEKRR